MSDDFVTYLRALAEKHPRTVRSAARMRQPLDGADAQALEGALCSTERERDEARAEVERLREALALGSEVLASHQGTLKREWHNVGAWLYAGDTINVVRAPLPEIAAPESAEGDR